MFRWIVKTVLLSMVSTIVSIVANTIKRWRQRKSHEAENQSILEQTKAAETKEERDAAAHRTINHF